MTAMPDRLAELAPEFEQIAAAEGCELVHAELRGGVLRLILDRQEGGVTLADCERVSKQVSALLDVLDFGKSRYVLEVGSPGLDRQLYKPRDYERFVGRLARVTVQDPETGKKRTVVARLAGFDAAAGEVALEHGGTEDREVVRLLDIKLARLEIEL